MILGFTLRQLNEKSSHGKRGALSMPITTIRFQIDLVSFPKQECDIDLPPILKHAGDLLSQPMADTAISTTP